jgi:hypothetical protein
MNILGNMILAATTRGVGSVFVSRFINQTLDHCRRSSTLSVKPTGVTINRLRKKHLFKIAHL